VKPADTGAAPAGDEASLARSFWLDFVLPWLGAHLGLDGLATWMALHGTPLAGGSMVWLAAWPLFWLWLAWGAWRTTRAASVHAACGGPAAARIAALATMALVLLFTATTTVLHVLPRVPAAWRHAQGEDSLPAARMTAAPEGHKLLLQGPLAQGDGERTAALVSQAGAARLLELQSSGGHRAEALRLAETLAAGGWRTRVVGPCEMACVLVFLAGRDRQLMPEGRLALHRQEPASLNPLWRTWARQEEAAQWQRAGLPPMLVIKALSAPANQPWHPEMDELTAAGLVGVPGRPLDLALPAARAPAPATEWLAALRSNPVWLTLERKLPGTLAAAAEHLQAARETGTEGATLQTQAQRAIQARLPDLLRDASISLREHYAGLQAERLAAIGPGSADTCRRVLAADPALLRDLPAPLRQREAAWLADVATETPDAHPARGLNALEHEVLSRALGERAPGLLVALGRPERASSPATGCAMATQLLAEVLKLPAAERRLALRLMYDRP
jgi:hypothetical protein